MSTRTEIHDRVLNAKNREELMAAYAEWARRYDSDLLDELGYVAPALLIQLFAGHVSNGQARILDAGCGTGIVGELLTRRGFQDIDGLDYSKHMLQQAQGKGVYRELLQADLTQDLDIAAGTYDAVVSAGTFTLGHVGPEALGELIRITKPGGHICFTVREEAWTEAGYAGRISALVDGGTWAKVEEKTEEYIKKEDSHCRLCLYRVSG
jgi:predicted TPR repeat methyltransferase